MKEQRIQNVLAMMLTAVVASFVFLLFFRETPSSNKELVSLALGVMLGSMKDTFNYYFNSTRSSDRKDGMVEAALQQLPVPPSTVTVTTIEKEVP